MSFLVFMLIEICIYIYEHIRCNMMVFISFISFIISQGTKKSSYKTKQTLKMQTCSK